MKAFNIIWLLLFSLAVEAQNWENICSPGITSFTNPVNRIYSFRQDSAKIVPGTFYDSIYRSFNIIRMLQSGQTCYDTVYGSILGNKVYRKFNGTFIFSNHDGDSIFIRTGADLNQSWKIFLLPNSAYLLATVSEITTDSVCGVQDEVKVITLQAKNASNQDIYNIFNNKQIILSKDYGLTRTYDMVTFPTDTTPLLLIGKSTPVIGVQDFSVAETFNYNAGDEFHSTYYEGCTLGGSLEKTIMKVLAKQVSGTGDTIVYTMEQCDHGDYGPPPQYWNLHDTIQDTIILHEANFYSSFNKQPLEFSPKPDRYCDLYSRYNNSFNERSCKYFYEDYAMYSTSYGCWVYNINYPYWQYAPGLGQTHYFYQYLYWNDEPPQWITVTDEWKMVYYHKGTEEWGTPLAPNCTVLVNIDELPTAGVPGITVIPDPVINQAEIKVTGLKPGEHAVIYLYDCPGREIYRSVMDTNPFILKRGNSPNGLYILKVTADSGSFTLTSKVLFN